MGDVYGHLYSGNTPSRKNSTNFGGDTPWIRTADLNNGLIKSATEFLTYEGIKQLKILPENTIVLAMYGGFNQIGRTGILGFPATINQALVALTPHENINQVFAQSYLNRHIIDWRRVAASSRKDPNITKEDVEKSNFSFGSLEEQNRISKLISRLDHTITLHEEKKRQLERLKSALLQKMFADKNGYPAVRFRGFDERWEQYKAKELFESKSEKDHSDLPVLSATQENGIVFRNDLDIDIKFDTHALSNYKVVSPGDYIISLRSFQGGFELSEKLGIISPAYTVFAFNNREKTRQNSTFWKYFFKRYDFIESLKRLTFGIRDGKAISFNQFSTLNLSFPNFDDQNKIATLLCELDKTITLYDRKLNLLKCMKQSLLQKMFV